MILTITLNPALDKSTVIEKLIPEKKMRCTPMQVEAGGGGINVSKAVRELGGESKALFPAGGLNGELLHQLLREKGIDTSLIPIAGETRENFSVTDLTTNAQYRFVLPGPVISEEELNNCFKRVEKFQPSPTLIVFSGSLPPDMSHDVAAKFAALSRRIGAKFITDTSGDSLKRALHEGIYLLKPNLSELCFLVDKPYLELTEVEDAARSIINTGNSEVVVVSMGPSGALLLTKDICTRIPAPIVKKTSTIGAGDSMVAGIVLMLSQGRSIVEAVQFGVASGTAATMNTGSQLCKKEDVWKLFEWIKLHSS